MHDALCEPRPIQAHLPILIGGSGRQRTLRTVAERATAWNTSGSVDQVSDALATLERHCATVGRDPATIEKTVSFPIILRDDPAAADARIRELLQANGVAIDDFDGYVAGTPVRVAETLAAYRDLGFETFIVRMPAPFDHETIERMGEVAALLDR
jgi:alkanesulfonate monooxygenase SsuD/methylene tetrahydromethanopterin reductase-like flavin-dependent oxidoreductase (luciferase family)